ncbi:MAG: hypothetical protein A4E24_00976 [Methanomethylovorans sp. PtaU1.Bin093]|jgi:hypothetical protein|uniref:DUF1538 domain-containing protein n=1 Tax=Methanomethylovorans sp. PtaU1.Bin093 TaxID=1811679 RepID=UPI0009D479C7|nr:DUF1538 domain-containing protein [Methanomethylovorans sp. PtaU1.Bin093]OPY20642.1 MAG: hypothetical protein A4E24_00976 [Methanomethylovorans sp. PtaU1.Bin093]
MIQDFKETYKEVLQAVLPLAIAVMLIILLFMGMDLDLVITFLKGAIFVIFGMGLFLMGVKLGMLPLGEAIGADLPKHGSVIFIAIIGFLLSFMATVAEPDVRVLSTMIESVSDNGIQRTTLIISISLGVGFFVAASMLRIIYGIPLKHMLFVGYLIVVLLAFFTPVEYLAISFDSGGVTTGPVTVPVILALGIGISSVLRGKSKLSESYGLIGLASLGPILSLMILGILSH